MLLDTVDANYILTIYILYLTDSEQPQQATTSQPVEMKADLGGSFNLNVDAKDAEKVEWYHNGTKLNSCDKTRITNDKSGSKIQICDITQKDAGHYKMVAYKGSQQTNAEFMLTINESKG